MIERQLIQLNLALNGKEAVFEYLADIVVQGGYATDKRAVFTALKNRESEGTTGMMDGFAIPHAKSPVIMKPVVAVLTLQKGIDWDSMDGLPARFIVALFIPEDEAGTTHLQLLSKLARLLMRQEFKQRFEEAASVADIEKLLQKELTV